MAGVSQGPSPWWQLPEYAGKLPQLQKASPAGYAYNPVDMGYERTPASAGANLNAFSTAAQGGTLGSLSQAAGFGVGGATPGTSAGGSVGGVGGAIPYPTSTPGGAPAPTPTPDIAFPTAAVNAEQNAQFARAKDLAGNTATASMNALQQALASRGMGGGGYEGGQIGQTLSRTANTIGEAGREEAIQGSQLAREVANENYQGGIVQRGQDIGAQESANSLATNRANTAFEGAISQRQQDISAGEESARLAQQQAEFNSTHSLEMLKLALSGGAGGARSQFMY